MDAMEAAYVLMELVQMIGVLNYGPGKHQHAELQRHPLGVKQDDDFLEGKLWGEPWQSCCLDLDLAGCSMVTVTIQGGSQLGSMVDLDML